MRNLGIVKLKIQTVFIGNLVGVAAVGTEDERVGPGGTVVIA